jgi:OOP family OmpA-OmpF porin
MRKQLLTVAVASLLWAGQAAAVTTDGNEIPYFGAAFSYEFADSNRDSDNGKGFSLTLGTPLEWGENNALELSFLDVGRSRKIDGNDDYQDALSLDFVHDLGLFGWGEGDGEWLPQFKPYVLVGASLVRDDVRGEKHNKPGANAGAGLIVPLPWYGAAVRAEVRAQGQVNDQSVPGEDLLIDYRINIGLQVPLTPIFGEPDEQVERAHECDLAVVDPETGRSDCGADSDSDGVIDGADRCPGTPPGLTVGADGCPAGSNLGTDQDADSVPDGADACPDTKSGLMVDMNGCAVEQTMSLKNIYFSNDTAELTDESRRTLDSVAATIKGQPNLRVEIGGHTDSIGSAAYNLMLAQQRAEAVRQYLISKGVESNRLTAQGYGEFRPNGSNEKPDERASNRRVEFKLIVE